MVRISRALMKDAAFGLRKTISEILVCPLTKNPLRYCEKTNSLISDEIGVSFPLMEYPAWFRRIARYFEDNEASNVHHTVDSSATKEDWQ